MRAGLLRPAVDRHAGSPALRRRRSDPGAGQGGCWPEAVHRVHDPRGSHPRPLGPQHEATGESGPLQRWPRDSGSRTKTRSATSGRNTTRSSSSTGRRHSESRFRTSSRPGRRSRSGGLDVLSI